MMPMHGSFCEIQNIKLNLNMLHSAKENANNFNTNKPLPPKVGVFFNKDQKMIALEKQNQQMQVLLNTQMAIFNQLSKDHKQFQDQKYRIQNQNSLNDVEFMMLRQSIVKLEAKFNSTNPQILQKQAKISQLTNELNKIQQDLSNLMAEDQKSKNLIRRYKQELKIEKQMMKSDKNLNNILQSMRKNHQNYVKNISILQNKLESKKKYLQILLTKQSKQKKQEQNSHSQKQISSKLTNPRVSSQKRMPQNKIITTQKLQQTNQKTQAKNMKGFNQLIRKKNAILARNR